MKLVRLVAAALFLLTGNRRSCGANTVHQSFCSLEGQRTIEMAQNTITGEFIMQDQNATTPSAEDVNKNDENSEATMSPTSTMTATGSQTEWTAVQARICHCNAESRASVTYCSTAFTHCVFYSEDAAAYSTGGTNSSTLDFHTSMIPECTTIDRSQRFVRSAVPIIMIWFGGITFCLVGTKRGKYVSNYIFSCCFPRWTEIVADRMLSLDPVRARRLIRRNWRQRRQIHSDLMIGQDHVEAAATAPHGQTHLMLRTQIYNTASEALTAKNVDDDDDDVACAICFGPIEHGDRVGALPCHHLFHAECLKTWLVRRQVCPLCQSTDVVERKQHCHGSAETVGLPLDSSGSSQSSEDMHDHGTDAAFQA